ncbi:trans-aconitate 2-methyltransferase [Aureimonas sp. AU12]|uniref:trans-aconitate 2-methyltransferase n=1 Tax=Aureimonas sp. AU12 TaxID=1638161 RepID=UPI0007859305|nr:trans-aconitate 2-methyltransferase [Aureimonas sp. AU12]
MADWNPALYTRFEEERTRPARDLLRRCEFPLDRPFEMLRIADLGCGPGNSTALLAERFPGAAITGFDTSEAMLEAARARLPQCRFALGDIAAFEPDDPFDLVFSNAALQWVLGHRTLIPALMRQVAPGGVFAAQIPDNLADPSQVAMREIALEPDFAPLLAGDVERREAIGTREDYYDWLSAAGRREVDVWTTIYNHPMADAQAITDWFSSTGLKPFIDPLPDDLSERFKARYTQEMDRRYPVRADGRRLLAFPRLFMVARKG